jgi:Fur family transcriptional regulator, ferric uptake regulator
MSPHRSRRNTRQRQVILEELRKLTSHPTAAGLYATVSRRLSKISLGTVYRNLELLARTGAIQKLQTSGEEARYDGNATLHDHMRCVRCGRVDDVSAPPLDPTGGVTNDWGGYELLGYRLEFLGICPRCKASQRCVEDGSNAVSTSENTISEKSLMQ